MLGQRGVGNCGQRAFLWRLVWAQRFNTVVLVRITQYNVRSHPVECVSEWPDLGHVVSADCNDKSNILLIIDGMSCAARLIVFYVIFLSVIH